MEFQAIYNNVEKLSKILLDKKIKFSILKTSILLNSMHFSEKFTKKMEQLHMDMIGVAGLEDGPLLVNYLQLNATT